jgi:hypothetical protein
MMIMLTMTAILIGALLGLRFKVFILLPATVIVLAVTLAAGMAYSGSLWSTLPAMVLATAALQIGYLTATVVAGTRVSKDSPGPVAVAQRRAH